MALGAKPLGRRRPAVAKRARAAAIALVTSVGLLSMRPRHWWLLGAAGAFAWWARARIVAHREHVGESIGQRAWGVFAALRDEYSEGEREALRMVDARLVVAIESGDLRAIEPLIDEAEAIVTPADAARVCCDLRAFARALEGDAPGAAQCLARADDAPEIRDRGWSVLARALLARAGFASRVQPVEDFTPFAEHAPPVRALAVAVAGAPSRPAVAYRSAATALRGRRAYESWMLRMAPDFVSELPAIPALASAIDASWNRRSTALAAPDPARPWLDRFTPSWLFTVGSLALLQGLALAYGAQFVRHPTAQWMGVFMIPVVGLVVAAKLELSHQRARRASLRQTRAAGADRLQLPRNHRSHHAALIDEQLFVARRHLANGDPDALERSREAFSRVWSLGSPRDRALLYRTHAVHLAWLGHEHESESILARMDEDHATYAHGTAARFEARLVAAVVREDRARAAKIARERVDTLPLSMEVELLALAVYAATTDASLRDHALALHSRSGYAGAMVERYAPWVLRALRAEDESAIEHELVAQRRDQVGDG